MVKTYSCLICYIKGTTVFFMAKEVELPENRGAAWRFFNKPLKEFPPDMDVEVDKVFELVVNESIKGYDKL